MNIKGQDGIVNNNIDLRKLIEENKKLCAEVDREDAKAILKQAIKEATLPLKICDIGKDLHPTTIQEIQNHIHQIQNILIAEYVRFTDIKEELDLI